MGLYRLGSREPQVAKTAYVAENASVVGDVALAERCSVWFHAVIRGDNAPIRIGADSNVQDGAVLHGCTIGDWSLIGIDAVILDNAVVGRESKVAAGSVLLAGREYPPGSLIVGSPAVVKRALTAEEIAHLREHAERYVRDGSMYRDTLEKLT